MFLSGTGEFFPGRIKLKIGNCAGCQTASSGSRFSVSWLRCRDQYSFGGILMARKKVIVSPGNMYARNSRVFRAFRAAETGSGAKKYKGTAYENERAGNRGPRTWPEYKGPGGFKYSMRSPRVCSGLCVYGLDMEILV